MTDRAKERKPSAARCSPVCWRGHAGSRCDTGVVLTLSPRHGAMRRASNEVLRVDAWYRYPCTFFRVVQAYTFRTGSVPLTTDAHPRSLHVPCPHLSKEHDMLALFAVLVVGSILASDAHQPLVGGIARSRDWTAHSAEPTDPLCL